MKLETFIERHRLRQRRDECGDLNAIGKRGTVYEYGSGLFAATIMNAKTAQHWNTYREQLNGVGCRIVQNGDTEGSATFNPEDEKQVAVVLKAIQARHKRKVTPELLARLAEMRAGMAGRGLETKTKPSDEV